MDEVHVKAIAAAVVEELHGSVISSALPAHVGEWLREAAAYGQRYQQNQVYLSGPNCLLTKWLINTDGTLQLEFDGPDGSFLWRGVFRPVVEYPTCSLGHPTRQDGSHVRKEDKHG